MRLFLVLTTAAAAAAAAAHSMCAPMLRGEIQVRSLPDPGAGRSRTPRFGGDSQVGIHLSWVEESKSSEGSSSCELRFAKLEEDAWGKPQAIASGEHWIVNWADFSAVARLDAEHLIAHFLERSGKDSYDYHVRFVQSDDGGKSWSASKRLHSDDGPGEHGFVSWAPLGERGVAAVWLDGRNTKTKTSTPGPMALYTRTVAKDGSMSPEVLLDARVCDCCQTALVRAPDGALLVAYRDRSDDEVRDISIMRLADGAMPQQVWNSADGWKIAGCPVNGPVLAATADRVALVWFTLGGDGKGRVLCAMSENSGRSFSLPMQLAGDAASGRVDAVFDLEGKLIVAWLEVVGVQASWRVARIDRDGKLIDVETGVKASSGRDSGLARLAADERGVILSYTQTGTDPRVVAARLSWNSVRKR